jgi:hypothetical protein
MDLVYYLKEGNRISEKYNITLDEYINEWS